MVFGIALVANCGGSSIRPSAADDASLDVATEICDKKTPDGKLSYAEHAYPGRTKAELARAAAFISVADPTAVPSGYDSATMSYLLIRDGAVAAVCNNAEGKTITFVLPR
jgi:hypothetical protein